MLRAIDSSLAAAPVLELRQLRSFVGVAEELHFGRAASRLFISQPALSRQIDGLERELGVELFLRVGRHVQLTSAGAVLLERARTLLSDALATEAAVTRAAREIRGRVSLGFVPSSTLGAARAIAAALRCAAPGLDVTLAPQSAHTQLETLRAHEVDVALVGPDAAAELEADLTMRIAARERLLVAIPVRHTLARAIRRHTRIVSGSAWGGRESSSITLARVSGERFVLFPRAAAPGLRDAIDETLRAADIAPRDVETEPSPLDALAAVASELGVTFVPPSIARLWREDIVYATLSDPHPAVMVHAAWHRDREHPELGLLLDTIARSLGIDLRERVPAS